MPAIPPPVRQAQGEPADLLHTRAVALHAALNELFQPTWDMAAGSRFYVYSLTLPTGEGRPFVFHRAIEAKNINCEPFRTALQFADEACERYGRWVLLKPEDAQP